MKKLVRVTALIGMLVLASGAPAYARGGGGGHGGGGGFSGGGHAGGGHAFGGPHGGFAGHHGFDGHHGFAGHRFHGDAFVGFGPYWGPVLGSILGVLAVRTLPLRAVDPDG